MSYRGWKDKESEKLKEVRKDPVNRLVTKFLERGGGNGIKDLKPQGSRRGTTIAIGTEVRLEDISMNESFSRDSTNNVDSLCLTHFKGGVLPRSGEQGCVQSGSIISTTSPNPNQSLQELKS